MAKARPQQMVFPCRQAPHQWAEKVIIRVMFECLLRVLHNDHYQGVLLIGSADLQAERDMLRSVRQANYLLISREAVSLTLEASRKAGAPS